MLKSLAVLGLVGAAAFAQTPTVTSVYNQFTYGSTLCPGLLVIITGTNFGSTAANVTVSVGGQPAYLLGNSFYFTSTGFSAQLPFNIPATGTANLIVTVAGTPSASFPINLAAVSPGLQTPQSTASGPAYVIDAKTAAQITYANPATNNEILTTFAVGLGVTTPATPIGVNPNGTGPINAVVPTPKVTVGGVAAVVGFAGASGYGGGVYQINFTVPNNVQGTQPLVITLQGVSSSSTITLPVTGLSSVVVNGSFANPGTIAPGSIASVFANSLGASTQNLSEFPNTSSEGVQVTFSGTPAPMFHLIPAGKPKSQGFLGTQGQIDLLVPSTLPTSGTVNVQLTTSTANFPDYTLNMVPALPSMFRFTDNTTNNSYAIVQFSNSAWVVLPAAAATDIGLPVCAASTGALTECGEPANIGDYLVIYLTGLGLATPNGDPKGTPLPSGQNPPISGNPLYETPTMPTVTIGGIATTPAFSGLTPGYAGEYQIVVQVPPGVASGDSVPVEVTMMGQSDTANISIQPTRVPPPGQ